MNNWKKKEFNKLKNEWTNEWIIEKKELIT